MNRAMHEREVVSGMAVFVAIVDSGSLSAAARHTGLTPSAVSKLLGRLEHQFGSKLVRRTTRSMTVTDAGQMFYERAQSVLEELRAVDQEMANKDTQPRGLVRVSASLMLGQTRVVPSLLAFLKKTPAISMDLQLTDRIVDMVGERIDVAVRITGDPPPSYVAKRVGTIKRVLCASPSYLRQRAAPRAPGELADHTCLLLSNASASTFWTFTGKARKAEPTRVRVTGRLRASNTLSLYEAALAGLGIAELPRYLVEQDLKARRLVRVLDSFDTGDRDVFVVYAAGALLPARVRVLVSFLVGELQSVLREGAV